MENYYIPVRNTHFTLENVHMIKMIIKMDDSKISSDNEYSIERVYSGLDRIFAGYGYHREEIDGNLEYKGYGDSSDFGKFGRIYNGLRKQPWFSDNVATWILCNSDDVDDPDDFSYEDLLHYDGSRVNVRT